MTADSPKVSNIKVTMSGKDVEYWAGNYGSIWQNMDLYIGNDDWSLLDDASDWHVSESSAVARDDTDGRGKIIWFSYYWDQVWA